MLSNNWLTLPDEIKKIFSDGLGAKRKSFLKSFKVKELDNKFTHNDPTYTDMFEGPQFPQEYEVEHIKALCEFVKNVFKKLLKYILSNCIVNLKRDFYG